MNEPVALRRADMEDLLGALRTVEGSGVFQPGVAPGEVARAARRLGFGCHAIDLGRVRDKAGLFAQVAAALALPRHFGHNWDALNDCLTDEAVIGYEGFVIVFTHADRFAKACPADFTVATEVMTGVAEFWRDAGRPCRILMHGSSAWNSGLALWPATSTHGDK